MSLTYAQANSIIALASSMAGAHLGTCVTRPDRCASMVTTDSARRNRIAERELVEYLDGLIAPTAIFELVAGADEYNAWQDLRAVCGLMCYVPSEVWGDQVLTQDPKAAQLAREYGRDVQPLYTLTLEDVAAVNAARQKVRKDE